ncbi:flagellar biosynthetic protein FliO [Dankookia rubra]|uniref:flagellar biosynthetic protein FliO n=1 Tax=Dankookia rubra TaxID=1442381 RepID=UPI001F4FA166|nr:flagellar biosynthetic protein FliO [Dankookia rubra]
MILETNSLLKAFGALAALTIPLWLGGQALRRGKAQGRPGRRLEVAEIIALDARRRLVLVRYDGRELLLLTGGGQDVVLGWQPERPVA